MTDDNDSIISPILRRTERFGTVLVAVVSIVIYAVLSTVSYIVGNDVLSIVLLIPSTILMCVCIVRVLNELSPKFVESITERKRSPEFRMAVSAGVVVLLLVVALVSSSIPSTFTIPVVFSAGFIAVGYALPANGDKKDEKFDAKDVFLSSMLTSGEKIPFVGKKKKEPSTLEEMNSYEYDDESYEEKE